MGAASMGKPAGMEIMRDLKKAGRETNKKQDSADTRAVMAQPGAFDSSSSCHRASASSRGGYSNRE